MFYHFLVLLESKRKNFNLVLKIIRTLKKYTFIHFNIVGSGRNELAIFEKSKKMKLKNF